MATPVSPCQEGDIIGALFAVSKLEYIEEVKRQAEY